MKVIKVNLYKLPFFIKLWYAKRFLRVSKIMLSMFRGFGPTFPNDLVLFTRIHSMNEELELWIKTEGRPTTSNINYHLNK